MSHNRENAINTIAQAIFIIKRGQKFPIAVMSCPMGVKIATTQAVNKVKTRVSHFSEKPFPYRPIMSGLIKLNKSSGVTNTKLITMDIFNIFFIWFMFLDEILSDITGKDAWPSKVGRNIRAANHWFVALYAPISE